MGCVNFVTRLPLAVIPAQADNPIDMPPLKNRSDAEGPALRATLRKLLNEADRAIGSFDKDPADRAHFIRTRMKRLQSLCRLVPVTRPWRENFLPVLRDLKDLFAPVRDETIIRALAEKYAPGQAIDFAVVPKPDLARAAGLIQTAREALGAYPGWPAIEWDGIADRAKGTYRAARRAWKLAARKNAPDAAFHDCRRRVKRLFYQCEYLGGRARLARMTRRADQAGEVFGEIQDVCMAEDWLKDQGIKVPADLPRSKTRLRNEALRRATKLLEAKPREFRKMLG